MMYISLTVLRIIRIYSVYVHFWIAEMFHYAMIILILHGSKAKQNISTLNLIKVKVYTETMLVQNYTNNKNNWKWTRVYVLFYSGLNIGQLIEDNIYVEIFRLCALLDNFYFQYPYNYTYHGIRIFLFFYIKILILDFLKGLWNNFLKTRKGKQVENNILIKFLGRFFFYTKENKCFRTKIYVQYSLVIFVMIFLRFLILLQYFYFWSQ